MHLIHVVVVLSFFAQYCSCCRAALVAFVTLVTFIALVAFVALVASVALIATYVCPWYLTCPIND